MLNTINPLLSPTILTCHRLELVREWVLLGWDYRWQLALVLGEPHGMQGQLVPSRGKGY